MRAFISKAGRTAQHARANMPVPKEPRNTTIREEGRRTRTMRAAARRARSNGTECVHSNALKHHGDALPHADAHGAKRVAAAASGELISGRGGEPRPRCAKRVAERDGSAIRIDARIVIADPECSRHGQRLRSKRFIQFDDIYLLETQPGNAQDFAHRLDRPDAHHARRNARARHGDDPRARAQAKARNHRFVRAHTKGNATSKHHQSHDHPGGDARPAL